MYAVERLTNNVCKSKGNEKIILPSEIFNFLYRSLPLPLLYHSLLSSIYILSIKKVFSSQRYPFYSLRTSVEFEFVLTKTLTLAIFAVLILPEYVFKK